MKSTLHAMVGPEPGLTSPVAESDVVTARPADLQEFCLGVLLYALSWFDRPELAWLVPVTMRCQLRRIVVRAAIWAPMLRYIHLLFSGTANSLALQAASTSSSAEMPMSRAILRNSTGEISCPLWNGTVVPRPSGWRNCLWAPRWRTSTNPIASRRDTTSRGFSTGSFATVRVSVRPGFQRTRLRGWVHHLPEASR